jgi:hypothetical protein
MSVRREIQEEYLAKDLSPQRCCSLINGRSVSNDPHDILDALIHEYQHLRLLQILSFSEDTSVQLLSSPCFSKVYEFLPPLQGCPILEGKDLPQMRLMWPTTLKSNSTDPFDELRARDRLVFCQVFLDINSPEAKPTLEVILDMCLENLPFAFQLSLLGDMKNLTLRHIIYAYWAIVAAYDTLKGSEFLLRGMEIGFEAAYGETKPRLLWRNLPHVNQEGIDFEQIEKTKMYCMTYNIKKTMISVNGHVIRTAHAFRELKSLLIEQGIRIKTWAQSKAVTNSLNFMKRLPRYGIPLEEIDAPLKIGIEHQATIDGMAIVDIQKVLAYLMKRHFAYPDEPGDNRIPVFFIDCDEQRRFSGFEGPAMEVRYLMSAMIPIEVRQVLRTPGTKTMVGPLLFNHTLSICELTYVLHYVRLGFCDSLAAKYYPKQSIAFASLTSMQMMYILLWRSSLHLRGVTRSMSQSISSQAWLKINGSRLLEWVVIIDPFSEEYRMVAEMLVQVAELKVARVSFLPVVPLTEFDFGRHLHSKFVPVILQDSALVSAPVSVEVPPGWVTRPEKNIIWCTAVTHVGFAPGSTMVQIGGQTRRPLDNGYFLIIMPIGAHQTKGVIEPFCEFDSMVVRFHHFTPTYAPFVIQYDRRFHILSYIEDPTAQDGELIMSQTLRSHITCEFKQWLFSGLKFSRSYPPNTEILPRFWPQFLPPINCQAFCKAAKLALVDILIPLEVPDILFVDPKMLIRRDVSAFRHLELTRAVCAAPLISSSKKKLHYWNRPEFVCARLGRPAHSTALLWIDMERWRNAGASDKYRRLWTITRMIPETVREIDNDLFNLMQLDVQVATLPENTAFCTENSEPHLAASAFSIVMCSRDSAEIHASECEAALRNAQINVE